MSSISLFAISFTYQQSYPIWLWGSVRDSTIHYHCPGKERSRTRLNAATPSPKTKVWAEALGNGQARAIHANSLTSGLGRKASLLTGRGLWKGLDGGLRADGTLDVAWASFGMGRSGCDSTGGVSGNLDIESMLVPSSPDEGVPGDSAFSKPILLPVLLSSGGGEGVRDLIELFEAAFCNCRVKIFNKGYYRIVLQSCRFLNKKSQVPITTKTKSFLLKKEAYIERLDGPRDGNLRARCDVRRGVEVSERFGQISRKRRRGKISVGYSLCKPLGKRQAILPKAKNSLQIYTSQGRVWHSLLCPAFLTSWNPPLILALM